MNHTSRTSAVAMIASIAWIGCLAVDPATGQSNQANEPSSDRSPPPTERDVAADMARPFDLRTAPRLTGDWGGVRTDLEEVGVKFKIKLMNQLMVNMYGGKETRNGHDTAGSYEFSTYLDLEKMHLVDGAEFFFRAKGTWGGDDSDFDKEKIGGIFKTNQDAGSEEPLFIDKWHWKQKLLDGRLEFRIGRMEPVKDLFDCSIVMGDEDSLFLNRTLVRNATIPSNKGLGLFVNWNVTDQVYARVAALDAHSKDRRTNFDTAFHNEDEYRFFGELGIKPKFDSANGKLGGHYRVGTWFDPTTKERYWDTLGGLRAPRYQSGQWGFFVGFDQLVWKENDDPKDKQGLSIAGRYGYAHGEVNKVEHFWAAAAHYQGLFPTRDKDRLGLGVAQGILSDEYRRVHERADRETVYELYYAIYVTPWLTISPDLQFIANAGGDKDDRNALVGGLRFKMSL